MSIAYALKVKELHIDDLKALDIITELSRKLLEAVDWDNLQTSSCVHPHHMTFRYRSRSCRTYAPHKIKQTLAFYTLDREAESAMLI